jgi:tRNA nucleotidyltransferase (CCA-adding enzyme)
LICIKVFSHGAKLIYAFSIGKAPKAIMNRGSAPAQAKAPGWEHFPHDADVGVRGWGPTAASAFEQAAGALTAVITNEEVKPLTEVKVKCEAPDLELLFVEWLNAIIYEMAVRKMLFGRFSVRIEGDRLEGAMWGEPVDVARHAPACEPKGATYTALRVGRSGDELWSAECIVDV